MQHSVKYTLAFAAVVAFVASIVVATTAVVLRSKQEANRVLDRQRKVLDVASLPAEDERLSADRVAAIFTASVQPYIVELATGELVRDIDVSTFDQREQTRDPATSQMAADNSAGVRRVPTHALLYHILEEDDVVRLILPIEGQGLWSTIYGFIALSPDLQFVRGITFYEHSETPGLGGEINTSAWRAKWEGRRPFDANWLPRLEVIKGSAPPADAAPYVVDGLSGATLTGRAVTHIVQFWLGEDGFGPYLRRYRNERVP